jgi:basic membrane protein A
MVFSSLPPFARNVYKPLLITCALTAMTALALVGCGRTEEPTPSHVTNPTGSTDFKVALVMSGPKSDNGWNAGAAKAMEAVKTELKLPDDNVMSVDNQKSARDQENSLRDFAAKKVNLVFGHGAEYESIALKLESDFPNTLFIISSGRKVGHNTMPIVLKLEDGAYLEGMLAAAMSKTGKIGSVGAEKSVPLESIFSAFEKGAKSVKPDIIVIPPVYTGSWDNAGQAKSSTLGLLNQGADVIMQDVDAAAQGVFNAVQEFNKGGKTAYALGTNSNQNATAPDVILASAPIYTEKAFVEIAKEAKAGTLKANDKPLGMKEGIIDFILNPALESKLPADIKTKLADTQKKITDGSFDVLKGSP